MKAICYTEITQKIPFDFVYFHSKENEEPTNLTYEVISSKDELDRKYPSEDVLIIKLDRDSQISVYSTSNHQNFTHKLNNNGIYVYKKVDDTADIFKTFEDRSVNLSELFNKAEEIPLLCGQDENDLLEENENRWNKLIEPPKSRSPILSPKLLRNGENSGYSRSTSPSFNCCESSSPFKSPTKTRECYEKDNFRIRMPLSVRPVNLDLT